jgi:hypothetical protein
MCFHRSPLLESLLRVCLWTSGSKAENASLLSMAAGALTAGVTNLQVRKMRREKFRIVEQHVIEEMRLRYLTGEFQ